LDFLEKKKKNLPELCYGAKELKFALPNIVDYLCLVGYLKNQHTQMLKIQKCTEKLLKNLEKNYWDRLRSGAV
jgi:hypothetical protein